MNVYSSFPSQPPTLLEQGKEALGLNGTLPDWNAAPSPDPVQDDVTTRLERARELGINPLFAMIDQALPQTDPKRQEALKRSAKWDAIGNALSTMYGGYIGSKGGPILQQDSTYPIEAMKEYNANIAADKENKYKTSLAKMGILSDYTRRAMDQEERDRLAKQEMDYRTGERQAQQQYETEQTDKKLKQQQDQFDKTLNYKGEVLAEREANNIAENAIKDYIAKHKKASGGSGGGSSTAGMIPFSHKGVIKHIAPEQANAILSSVKAQMEAKFDPEDLKDNATYKALVSVMNKTAKPDVYQRLLSQYYDQFRTVAKAFSREDLDEAYGRVYGGQPPISTPESSSGVDVSKYGGSVGF